MSIILSKKFYSEGSTLTIAQALIGKKLCSNIDGVICTGIINECEAYCGVTDKASHAYGGRRTVRTEAMYASGGVSYIYLCYGIHEMFNVVTGEEHDPQAILIRSIIPIVGTEAMMKRCNKSSPKELSNGPGKLCKAMGISRELNGQSLDEEPIWIEDTGIAIDVNEITPGPRIGVDYAGADAALPYRFLWHGVIA